MSDDESNSESIKSHEYGGHPAGASLVDLYGLRTNEDARHAIRAFAGLGNLEKHRHRDGRVCVSLHRPDHVVLTTPTYPLRDVYTEHEFLNIFIDKYMIVKGYAHKDFKTDYSTSPYTQTTYWIDEWMEEKCLARQQQRIKRQRQARARPTVVSREGPPR